MYTCTSKSLTLFPWFPGELDPVATEVCWFVKLMS